MKRLRLLKTISVCYRLAIEAIEHLKTSELEEMMEKWFATANVEF